MKFQRINDTVVTIIENETSIDDVLTKYKISKKQRYLLYLNRQIFVNHLPVTQNKSLNKKDELAIQVFINELVDFNADELPLDVIYEDDVLLIVNKPAGMLVHPDHKEGHDTLANAVAHYFHITHQQHTIRPIHRLDYETSGLVLFCKCPFFQPFLDAMLAEKKIARNYQAIVSGAMKPQFTRTIDAPIGSDRHVNNKYRISKTGKNAVTHVTCLKENQRKKISLVECQLETGRTHQIRVHLASIQRAILSDPIYGSPSPLIDRCALHAYKLTLLHPMSMKTMSFEIEMPEDMKNCIRK